MKNGNKQMNKLSLYCLLGQLLIRTNECKQSKRLLLLISSHVPLDLWQGYLFIGLLTSFSFSDLTISTDYIKAFLSD